MWSGSRYVGKAELGEQGGVLRRLQKGVPRDSELGLDDGGHFAESQTLADDEPLLHAATALQGRHDIAPRLVLPQQIHAALERPPEPAKPGVQAEQVGMTDHAVPGEGVNGGFEAGAGGDGDGSGGCVGRPAGRESQGQANAE